MNREQLEALASKTCQDLGGKIGSGAVIVLMVAETSQDGKYNYFASCKGGALSVLGLLHMGSETILGVFGPKNITSIEEKGEPSGHESTANPT